MCNIKKKKEHTTKNLLILGTIVAVCACTAGAISGIAF